MTKTRIFRAVIMVSVLVFAAIGVLSVAGLIASGYAGLVVRGPEMVLSAPSPDGQYEAYVVEGLSMDRPNQAAYIEHSDRRRFLRIAKLVEDVDRIEDIRWSPDSRIVVFLTLKYLIATSLPTYDTVSIYLGEAWHRARPQRVSTFSSGRIVRKVAAFEFPEAGTLRFRFEGEEESHEIHLPLVDAG